MCHCFCPHSFLLSSLPPFVDDGVLALSTRRASKRQTARVSDTHFSGRPSMSHMSPRIAMAMCHFRGFQSLEYASSRAFTLDNIRSGPPKTDRTAHGTEKATRKSVNDVLFCCAGSIGAHSCASQKHTAAVAAAEPRPEEASTYTLMTPERIAAIPRATAVRQSLSLSEKRSQ